MISLEEVQPGQTICRVPPSPSPPSHAPAELAPFERHVLAALRAKAVDGVIPATALTTGTEDASARWHRELAQLVVVDAQQRGLTVDRWPKRTVRLVGAGVVAVVALVLLSAQIGGDAEDHPVVAGVAAAAAIGGAVLLGAVAGRMKRSLAQRPTPAGAVAEARWLGVRAHLAQNEQLRAAPTGGGEALRPAPRVRGRVRARGPCGHRACRSAKRTTTSHGARRAVAGAGFGSGTHGCDRRAGGRHPAIATLFGLIGAAISGYLLVTLASFDNNVALAVAAVLAFPLLWSLWVLSAAIPDLFTTRTVTGTVLRCRARARLLSSNDAEVLVLRRDRRRHPRPDRRLPGVRGALPHACTRARPSPRT